MDQIKIGKFIAACRKQKHLTQLQLADKLGITDRAISKWETGKAMPDTAIMLELCDALHITVNDLLNGEVVSSQEYREKLESSEKGNSQPLVGDDVIYLIPKVSFLCKDVACFYFAYDLIYKFKSLAVCQGNCGFIRKINFSSVVRSGLLFTRQTDSCFHYLFKPLGRGGDRIKNGAS